MRGRGRARRAFAVALVAGAALGAAAHAGQGTADSAPGDGAAGAPSGYEQRPDVIDFVDSMVRQHGFVRADLLLLFAHARFNATAARLMGPPAAGTAPLVWSEYRARFLDPVRIDAGVRFWQEHRDELARAEQVYGVAQEVIVGIIGVESLYGRNTGKFRVIDSLTTLAFDYPNKARDRSAFFRDELEQFLLLTRARGSDALAMRGSYAGAIGMPQFMPDSYLQYAVDFDGDGSIDLQDSAADAIGSVAHFLAAHGWRRGAPALYRVQMVEAHPDLDAIARLVGAGAEPSLTRAELEQAGFVVIDDLAPDERVTLVDLPDGDNGTHYVLGANNFYVVTRYNRSYAYAMAVLELGETVKAGATQPAAVQLGKTPVDR